MKLHRINFCGFFTFILIQGTISGCSSMHSNSAAPPAPSAYQKKAPPADFFNSIPPSEGSLWTNGGEMLFIDQKARKVGDTIVVDIVENTSSKMDANTKAERTSDVGVEIPTALGYVNRLAALPNSRKDSNFDYIEDGKLLETKYSSKTEGKGSSDRSGQVTASIGAMVTDVLPNSNLVVYGKREMKVNNESQYIIVSGIVRPEDIGQDNRVKSTYMAAATIEYSGRGILADKQRAGWMTRVLDRVWPF